MLNCVSGGNSILDAAGFLAAGGIMLCKAIIFTVVFSATDNILRCFFWRSAMVVNLISFF